MRNSSLQVTYRRGKFMAAYLYLAPKRGQRAAHTSETSNGIIIDSAEDGSILGIEFLSESLIDPRKVNEALAELGAAPIDAEDLQPFAHA